jgi:hypothetical protein
MVPGQLAAAPAGARNCIILFLVGGPSHLDTWDLKPDAPDTIRGPFRPIQTNVPGVAICEHFPRMAQRANRFALIRSVFHDAAPIHETGHQLLQTGHLCQGGVEFPHYGAVLSYARGPSQAELPCSLLLPGPIGNTGVSISHGQTAGFLGTAYEPAAGQVSSPRARQAFNVDKESAALRARYGGGTFGQSCLRARRLVEHGVRLVTVNMFDTVYDQVTWDCHADGGALGATLEDYKETLCPMFDQAYTALLDDLAERGMLQDTLVVAMGEFGRTPHLNRRGGRDHWPHVWSVLFAGGPVQGGRVIGASDKYGMEPKDRPVHAAEIAASIYHALGITARTQQARAGNRSLQLVEADPVLELFTA